MFKKISMYILCIAMVLSLVACSAGSDNSSENNATSKATGGSPADNTGSEDSESTPTKDEGNGKAHQRCRFLQKLCFENRNGY